MNPKAEKFFDAITRLREDLVEEAQDHVFRRKRSGWGKFGSLAACMMLVVSLGILAAMPKGCGGGAPSSNNMNLSGAPATPAEMPPGVNGNAPSGDGNTSSGSSDTAPKPDPSGEVPPAEAEQLFFSGQVLEVLEDGLLVEPFDDLRGSPARVRVPTAGLEDLPEFYPGGVVMVTCRQLVQENGEAAAEGVTALDLVEPDAP